MEFKAKIFGIKNVEKAIDEITGICGLKEDDLSFSIEVGRESSKVLVATGTCNESSISEVKHYFRNFIDLDFRKTHLKFYFDKTTVEFKMSYDPYEFMERRHSKMLW